MSESMEDDWEEQEIVPLDFRNGEQLRILEERRLIEEADNAITDDLFSTDDKICKNLTNNFIEKENNVRLIKAAIQINEKLEEKIRLKTSKQFENTEKQKELSNKIKKEKEDKKRLAEIYGEAEDKYDKYLHYEEYFYDN
jgi:hypothetical protein